MGDLCRHAWMGEGLCPACDAERERRHVAKQAARIRALEEALAGLVEALPRCGYCGAPATDQHMACDGVHSCYSCDACTVKQKHFEALPLRCAAEVRKAQEALDATR